jgi:hypothetical protein
MYLNVEERVAKLAGKYVPPADAIVEDNSCGESFARGGPGGRGIRVFVAGVREPSW